MHVSTFTGVLATCSVRVCDVKTEENADFLIGLVVSGYERTHWAGLRLASVLHHVPNVYNCGIRRCVHRVIVALLFYMRLF